MGLLVLAHMVLGTAGASAATQTISSPTGPLTRIVISDQLNCQVNHVSDRQNEFWPPTGSIGACTTQIAVGGQLYGPEDIPAGNDPTPFTPVSQSAVTGLGLPGDPYRIVTVVDVGTTGLRITETDSYVVGRENYRTDVKVENLGLAARNVVLYRAGDCFLQGDDVGFGRAIPATGEVACVGPADPDDPGAGPGSRIEQWTPISAGSTYLEAQFSQVWNYIDTMALFPNFCRCGDFIDNGAGLSWAFAVPAGGSATRSHLTTFSPLGRRACSDGEDNDGDGKIDHPEDPGCASPDDADETDPPPPPKQCADGQDNDGDGKADHPDDQGCSSAEDDSEAPDAPQCSDRLDNHSDGKRNFPADPGCASADDRSESPDPPPPPRPQCTIRGTSGNDIIRGTSGDDVICAGAGNDIVHGLGGNDIIIGGDGNDVLRGGGGNDRLSGGDGNDDLRGEGGHDRLAGGDGNDVLRGESGNDRLSGGEGNDVLGGGDGDDRLLGGPGRDTLRGQGGRDFLDTRDNRTGNDAAYGGPGDDDCDTDRGDARASC